MSFTLDILLSLPHQAPCGVVEDGTDVNLDVPPLVEGLVQQGHHILPFDPLTVKTLSPPDQAGLRKTLLSDFMVSIKKV